ncbi:spike base protein, RCAP_Rcc01079 family [Bacillus sp. OTU530]|uniref:spike base protein, RCAP_Rcc01079 family n=1 Tax=Bacillus sp. OTU530 TaxID=3043862 RepID=UPI00313CECF5
MADEKVGSLREYVKQPDGFYAKQVSLTGSNATDAAAVTPNDAADLAKIPTKGIYIGVTGDVKVTLSSGNTVTFTALASGTIHPIAVKRVWAIGTTATNILAVY